MLTMGFNSVIFDGRGKGTAVRQLTQKKVMPLPLQELRWMQ